MWRSDFDARFAGDIEAILDLKRTRNAVILAHNYQTPEIFHCVADITGDSLALARRAQGLDADVIVMAGVHFMAETAKMMNPDKTVLVPDGRAGCSLAEAITPANVRSLKAESDICSTSANANKIVKSLGVPEVITIPDEFLAQNIAAETGIRMIT